MVLLSSDIACRVSLGYAQFFGPPYLAQAFAAAHRRALLDLLRPAPHVLVRLNLEEFLRAVEGVEHETAVPGPVRHGGDSVVVAGQEAAVGEVAIEHVELALHLHR